MPGSATAPGGVRFYANITKLGPLKYRDVIGSIGILESLDNLMPIGQADCKTWDENGLAVWKLTVRGQPVEGRWIIVDREFKSVR
jgi:hypothetical protein